MITEKMDQSIPLAENSMSKMVNEYKSKCEALWWDAQTDFPAWLPLYNRKQQLERERSLKQFIHKLNLTVKSVPASENQQSIWLADIKTSIFEYCKEALDLNKKYTNTLFLEAFTKVTEEFTRKAKEFDPQINMNDISQALRNVWTMNSIQVMLDEAVRFTPPLFAYSMLYPYTDNYLDNSQIPLQLKSEFSFRLKNRLQGFSISALDRYEQNIYDLIDLIEGYYPRADYPEVYESLYTIHQAQTLSLLLQSENTAPYETDILGISFMKGGSSVLTDGYLIKGKLGREEACFLYGYGVLLQLIDDLRDMATDARNGHMTIFSQLAGKWPLDNLSNRLFNFGEKVLNAGERFCEPGFKELIEMNYAFLIMEAVAHNREFYSGGYLKKLETFTPLSLNYLRKLKPKLKKQFKSLNDIGVMMPVNTLLRSGVAMSK